MKSFKDLAHEGLTIYPPTKKNIFANKTMVEYDGESESKEAIEEKAQALSKGMTPKMLWRPLRMISF